MFTNLRLLRNMVNMICDGKSLEILNIIH
jgi:hypothetical protein